MSTLREEMAEVLRQAYLGPARPDAHLRAADAVIAYYGLAEDEGA